tara:strand:+ start:369 stop:683 length:315 start_codon:yes stop_codon:yes gene_type:complete
MGTLNAKGGVGGLARFANNQRLMSVDHSASMMTNRMVNLREIYWKGEEEAKAQKIKQRQEQRLRDHSVDKIQKLATIDVEKSLIDRELLTQNLKNKLMQQNKIN